ncbi:MAG: hypothetical protein LVQ97_04840 [Candidatus Micrarchaeales archaeon]|jgi:hypothetical protein|uniref:Uncharacterized protein n=1 Tax=Candidatus Micrarchaeum acidiphilum ARMAN-2 TaxID=425595 RepID=C7DGW4_MICA2|nr:MAG: hypothetical protein UNLARM2_0314 [Candidatus Micrarchaeum acidiphilum ARMAN-2]MCW6161485.1 hypothetical protein [Candidatus Micrarchaeales archaeon]
MQKSRLTSDSVEWLKLMVNDVYLGLINLDNGFDREAMSIVNFRIEKVIEVCDVVLSDATSQELKAVRRQISRMNEKLELNASEKGIAIRKSAISFHGLIIVVDKLEPTPEFRNLRIIDNGDGAGSDGDSTRR